MLDPHLGLAAALLSLAAGPLLATALARTKRLHAVLDGLVLSVVVGLSLVVLMPHALRALGTWAVPLAVAGFALPYLAERRLHRHAPGEAPVVLVAAVLALLVHEALDGAGLAIAGHEGHGHAGHAHEPGSTGGGIVIAILAHRLPMGLLLWWSVRPTIGTRATAALLAIMGACTVGGFLLGDRLEEVAEGTFAGSVNALLAGALVHVVFDHGPEEAGRAAHPAMAGAGALAGLGLVVALPVEAGPGMAAAAKAAGHLFLEAAPALLIGFTGAGLLSLVPTDTLARLMTGSNVVTSAVRGTIFGLPLPVCSCGVVPLYRSLIQKGVPPAAAMAFLVATPELGLDSLILSLPLLGAKLTAARVVAALTVALAAGVVAGLLARAAAGPAAPPVPGQTGSIVGDATPGPETKAHPLMRALRYGFVDSVDDLGAWVVAGILVAGALHPLIDPAWLARVPGWAQVLLMVVLGAPIYVCATAATPVAAVLIAKGVTPGAGLAFLLTGPATNVTTYGAMRTGHGKRPTFIIIGTILGVTALLCLTIDALGIQGLPAAGREHEHPHGPAAWGSAAVLAALLVASLLRVGPRGFLAQLGLTHKHGHSPTQPCDPAAPPPACCDHDPAPDDHGHDHHGHDHDHGHDHGHGHDHDHGHGHAHEQGHGHAHDHGHDHDHDHDHGPEPTTGGPKL